MIDHTFKFVIVAPAAACEKGKDRPMQVLVTTSGDKSKKYLLRCTPDQYLAGRHAYCHGKAMQEAFPFLSADDREFLISGMTPEEFDALFDESPRMPRSFATGDEGEEPRLHRSFSVGSDIFDSGDDKPTDPRG